MNWFDFNFAARMRCRLMVDVLSCWWRRLDQLRRCGWGPGGCGIRQDGHTVCAGLHCREAPLPGGLQGCKPNPPPTFKPRPQETVGCAVWSWRYLGYMTVSPNQVLFGFHSSFLFWFLRWNSRRSSESHGNTFHFSNRPRKKKKKAVSDTGRAESHCWWIHFVFVGSRVFSWLILFLVVIGWVDTVGGQRPTWVSSTTQHS